MNRVKTAAMKIFLIRFRQLGVSLILGLALTGYPLSSHAMSIFMGGDEPKTAPSPPKPVGAKPQVPPVQPGPKPTSPTGSVQAPVTGAPSSTTVSPPPVDTGSPATSAGAPKSGGVPVSAPPPVPVQAIPGRPAQAPVQADAQKNVTAQSSAPASPAAGVPKELSKPAVSPGATAAPTTPVAAAAKTPDLVEIVEGYTYDPKSRRDPFQSLTRLIKVDKTRAEMPPLQRVQISDLKLLGIMWGGYGYYGLVQTPDGKGYTVKEGMLMGSNNGVITTITDKAIIVTEPSVDITGKKSTKDVELLLRPKEVS